MQLWPLSRLFEVALHRARGGDGEGGGEWGLLAGRRSGRIAGAHGAFLL